MKLRILSLLVIWLLTNDLILSQWIQVDGPYGSIKVSAFIEHDSLKIIAASCGTYSASNILDRWNLKTSNTFSIYTKKGDSLFTGGPVDSGVIPPKPGGGKYYHRFVYSVKENSQYIFAGTQRGIYRANPASMDWESINVGLPLKPVSLIKIITDTIYLYVDYRGLYVSRDLGSTWNPACNGYNKEFGISSFLPYGEQTNGNFNL